MKLDFSFSQTNQQPATKGMKNKPKKQREKYKRRKQLLAATAYNKQTTTSKTKPKELERFQADMRKKETKQAKESRKQHQRNTNMQQEKKKRNQKREIYIKRNWAEEKWRRGVRRSQKEEHMTLQNIQNNINTKWRDVTPVMEEKKSDCYSGSWMN